MNVKEAISLFRFYQQSNHRKRTVDSYRFLLQHFDSVFSDRDLDSIKPDEIYHFLEQMTKTLSKSTRRLRYAQLKAFFLCAELHKKNNADTIVMRREGYRTPHSTIGSEG
ncbi:MAG: site-specific integrase [Proteobacteria bacterium]|nr:site-specific integrase [Pseudomonadota bacterium]